MTVEELQRLSSIGCTLVDTTCGSVLNVWKNVSRYAREGYTSVIHGKYWHEETRATASQATQVPGGHYLVVLDRAEAGAVCDYIRGSASPDPALRASSSNASRGRRRPGSIRICTSPRIGCANQTTMLSTESLAGRRAVQSRRCASATAMPSWPRRFRSFDTICSATQDRQDAVVKLLDEEPVDLMLVIGGYNSSNTCNLARICAEHVPTFHVAEPDGLLSADEIRHRSVADKREVVSAGWLRGIGRRSGRADVRRVDSRQSRGNRRAQAGGVHSALRPPGSGGSVNISCSAVVRPA